jgi:hypothetical protein
MKIDSHLNAIYLDPLRTDAPLLRIPREAQTDGDEFTLSRHIQKLHAQIDEAKRDLEWTQEALDYMKLNPRPFCIAAFSKTYVTP